MIPTAGDLGRLGLLKALRVCVPTPSQSHGDPGFSIAFTVVGVAEGHHTFHPARCPGNP